jgi:acetyltransferase-like isoleucine patch superfamily enzyme
MNTIRKSKIGKETKIWDYTVVLESTIGNNVNIGNSCELYRCTIGDYTRIGFGTFICEGVTIGKRCFISPGVFFTNDKYPILKKKNEIRKLYKTIIEDNVTIGANTTILPGLTIGKGSFIGAGSVVTKNVLPGALVYGNPARIQKIRGEKNDFRM